MKPRQLAAIGFCAVLSALFACGSSTDTSTSAGEGNCATSANGPNGCYCSCNDAMRDGAGVGSPCTYDNQQRLKIWDQCVCEALAAGQCATECAGQCGARQPLGDDCPSCVLGPPPYSETMHCLNAFDACDGS